jgi:hypothetical protein
MADKKGAKAQGKDSAANTPKDGTADLLKKITPVTVMGEKIAKLAPGKGDAAVELFTVFGIGNGTKKGDTQYGTWEALTGVFEAVRAADGARFQSAVCFLPGAAGEILLGGLKAAKEKDPDASVQFAIVVSVRFLERRDGTAGYEFLTREMVKPQQADLLADLRAKAIGQD